MLFRTLQIAYASGVIVMCAALAGCAGGGLSEAAQSLTGASNGPDMPDFVKESRPATPPTYIPVGVTPPARATPVRSAKDVESLEKELEGQRDRTKAFARRPTPRSSYDGTVPRRPAAGSAQ